MIRTTIKEYGKQHHRILIILTGWGNQQWMYLLIANILQKHGFRVFVVTYDASILSPDVEKTRESFSEVRDEVVDKIHTFRKNGETDISLYGVSLGSSLAFMVANTAGGIQKMVCNLTGANIAESVWSWNTVNKMFKQTFRKNGVTLEQLKKEWHSLSPENNLKNLTETKILIQATRKDEIIPFNQTEKLLHLLEEKEITSLTQISNNNIHLITGARNLYNFRSYILFLKD